MKSLFYIVVLYTFLVAHPASGQYIEDPYLYYSVGGGRAISPPATESRIQFGSNVGISGFSCGNFDPKLDVSSMLGGIGNTLADLKSIPSAITSALPGQILCRAQPSLCNLMQHYSVRAEDAWRFSVDACENILSESTDQPWIKFAKAQEWERQASAGTDATTAHRRVSETEDPCITWVNGELAGCPGHPALRPVMDSTRAGWCATNGQPPDCRNAGGSNTRASQTWSTPDAAAEWVADVVGDVIVTNSGSQASASHASSGLQPKISDEAKTILETLNSVLATREYPTRDQQEILSSPAAGVNTHLINALREVDENGIYAVRVAEEIALARVIDKALLARRLLLTGQSEPYIQSAEPGSETIDKAVSRLEEEIDRVVFEFRTRRAIVSGTSVELLNAYARKRVPASSGYQFSPSRLPY